MKLTDQPDVSPTKALSLPTLIIDLLGNQAVNTITAKFIIQDGRNVTELVDVVTVTNNVFSGTPATWTGLVSLSLRVIINGNMTQVVPLVTRGA